MWVNNEQMEKMEYGIYWYLDRVNNVEVINSNTNYS